MKLSIVVPAHNEAVGLERSIAEFIHTLPEALTEILLEVILVENGSTDGTLEVCKRLQQNFPNVIRVCTISRGSYGEAIKKGMLESQGTHVAILESDFLDPHFLSASIAKFHQNQARFVVGSKRHPQSFDGRPLKRRILTALYNYVFLRLLIGYPGSDTHGLKCMETPLAKRLCEMAITTDEIFQTEIVLLAWQLGVGIDEVPVQIREMRSPSVSVLRRLPKVLNTVRDLQRSLVRFQKHQATAKPV
jgi:glycosyltransferase AglD